MIAQRPCSAGVCVGIDAGSSATKCLVLGENARVLGHHVTPSGFDYGQAAAEALRGALEAAGAGPADVTACVATGYGRERVGLPPGGARAVDVRRVTEITCHAAGARAWSPGVRCVIDIGGQDTKVIRLCDRGRMADYRMNAKCAAGTGTFLESIAVRLGLPLRAVDALAMESAGGLRLNSYCTVFTSTEVLERIKDGEPRQDIAMGLFHAIASRVLEMMPAREGPVAVTGGVVTHCRAMVRALESALGEPVFVPPLPQHAGAYGAALLAASGREPQAPRTPRTISLEVRPC